MKANALMLASLALAGCSESDQPPPDAPVAENYRTAVAGWRKHGDDLAHHAIVNWVRVDPSGQSFWNGEPAGRQELAANLEAAAGFAPAPFLVLTIDEGVSDENARAVRQLADQSYCQEVGRTSCGEGPSPAEWDL